MGAGTPPREASPGASAPARRTKVAVLIGTLEVGGAELDIVRNFPRLNRDEFEVVVVTFGPAGPLAPELERQGIRVVSRGMPFVTAGGGPVGRLVRRVTYTLRVVPWIGRRLNSERADIVHFFLPHSYAYGMFACLLMHRKARRVMSRLSLNFYRPEHRVLSWLERNLFHRRVDIAIGNSKPILAELVEEGVDPSKVRLLYNGIDLSGFARRDGDRERARVSLGVGRDSFVMVSVGNLWTHKGHRDLIEACAAASEELPSLWRLLVAGRDEEGNRAALEKLIQERRLSDHVELLGETGDVATLLLAADLFVQPSHHEGLPNAVIEAMAASLPVIGTNVGGIPEALRAGEMSDTAEEESGWLVPPREPGSLAAAILEAAADPQQRLLMGLAARARAEAQFSLACSVARYETIYRELVA